MASWNPEQYLKFSEERTQPCRDLAARVTVPNAQHVVDLGCGPGNSTQVLAERWPDAEITGVDSAAEMINAAIQTHPRGRWIVGDIVKWAAEEEQQFDVVFSNAALQWLPDHSNLYPKFFARVAAGGALAVQIPSSFDRPAHRLLREMAAAIGWRRWFPSGRVKNWHSHDSGFYYDLMAPLCSRVELWETEYIHVMPNAEAVVEWYKGTGMRAYLQAIEEEPERERFLSEYLGKIRTAYPPRPDGRILFPFLRIFLIAYR